MSIIGSNILAGASGQGGGYTIERSLRFRSSATAYLNRTPASQTNRGLWTWSGWVKRAALGSLYGLFGAGNASNNWTGILYNNENLYFKAESGGVVKADVYTSAVFRDPSAWYHVIVVLNTSEASSTNRVKIYVNGVQQTLNTNTAPSGTSGDYVINAPIVHSVGSRYLASATSYLDGYLTEVNFIDGQALDPSSFGEYNEDTGVWQPAKYTGSYGTNGFYLPFSDNTTTTTLAADASGNSNDWTPNNISLTSGATYDSMTDTPTPYAGGGNYCTANPLITFTSNSPAMALLDGNLNITRGGSGWGMCGSTIAVSTGKWYWEATFVQSGSGDGILGIHKTNTTLFQIVGYSGDPEGYAYGASGSKFNNTTGTAYGASFTNGDLIGVALDLDAGTLTFYKNNSSQGTAFSSLSGEFYPAFSNDNSNGVGSWLANFGQRPFAYTPPTGFKPLHTGNLPDSAVVDGGEYFNAVTYTGTGSATQPITGVGFQPDLSWIKVRSTTGSNWLTDNIRGATKILSSNLTNAEATVANTLKSFDSDGFTVGDNAEFGGSARTYVGWNWKANGAGVSNTDGSITSTVSANPTAGFSVMTWSSPVSSGDTIGHGLNAEPKILILKSRSSTSAWGIFAPSILGNKYLYFDISTGNTDANYTPTLSSTTITVPTSTYYFGGPSNSGNNLCYAFAEVAGYSKFGSYTGNGSADGPFVYTGFRPAFVIIKSTTLSQNWYEWDNKREPYNDNSYYAIKPSSSDAEYLASGRVIDLTSNGFKIRGTDGAVNTSGAGYIYMAFAENPFKNSLAR